MSQIPSVQILNFTGGVNQSLPRDQIQLSETPAMQNFTILDGIAQKRTGYAAAANNPVSGGTEPFLGGRHYGDGFSGKQRFWAVTNAKAYIAATIGGTWTDKTSAMQLQGGDDQYISFAECVAFADYKNYLLLCQNHTNPLTAYNGATPSFRVTGATATNVDPSVVTSVGAFAGYTLDGVSVYISGTNITAGWYVVASHDDDELTMGENICDGGAGTDVIIGPGDEAIVWYADAPDASLEALLGADGYNDSDPYHRAKQVLNFLGSVFLLNTYEETSAGVYTPLPYRLRWSDQYKFTTADHWNPSATGSLAGYWDARLGLGAILAGAKIRNNLIIFLEEAIAAGIQTTDYTELFTFRVRVPHIGLYAPRLFCELGNAILFVGTDREIYMYYGGSEPDPIGGKIRSEFFDSINKDASGSYLIRNRSFCLHFRDIHAAGIFVPTSGNYPDTAWLYFYRDKRWEKITLPASLYLTGWGEWQRPAGETAENVPLVGNDVGDICQWDYAATSDKTTAIDAWIQTMDIQLAPRQKQEITEVWFEAGGDGAASSVAVSVSTDGGATFCDAESVVLASGWAAYRVTFATQGGYRFRLKFANAVADQKLLLGRIWTQPADGGESEVN